MSDERPHDETVSTAYRDLPGEHCPAHLDKEVLALAKRHAQHPNYARSINWTRPLAWAATIALCLAITLEIDRTPAPQEISPRPEAKVLPETDQAAFGLSEKFVDAPGPTKESGVERAPAAPARYKRADNEEAPAAAFDLMSKDTPVPRKAEEMAQLQAGTNAEQVARNSRCPEEVRVEPSSWLHCIEALEEFGDQEAADREREALIEVFPDFKLP